MWNMGTWLMTHVKDAKCLSWDCEDYSEDYLKNFKKIGSLTDSGNEARITAPLKLNLSLNLCLGAELQKRVPMCQGVGASKKRQHEATDWSCEVQLWMFLRHEITWKQMKSMNEWMNAGMNEWMNQRMNERINQEMQEMGDCVTNLAKTKKQDKQGNNDWTNQWLNDSIGCWCWYPLVILYSYWKWPFIVGFPINSMVIFHSFLYVYQRVAMVLQTCWHSGRISPSNPWTWNPSRHPSTMNGTTKTISGARRRGTQGSLWWIWPRCRT